MKIHEPATLVTDYLLGGLAAFLGARLLRAARGPGRGGARLWAWAVQLALQTGLLGDDAK